MDFESFTDVSTKLDPFLRKQKNISKSVSHKSKRKQK